FKDLLSPTRALTPEGRRLLQDLVDNSYGQFIGAVATGRQHLRPDIDKILDEAAIAKREGMTEARVRTFADGRVFTGEQAFDAGLIDSLGGINEAVEHLQTLIGDADIQVSRDLPDLNIFWDIFRSQLSARVPAFGSLIAPLQSNSVPLVIAGTASIPSDLPSLTAFNSGAAFGSNTTANSSVPLQSRPKLDAYNSTLSNHSSSVAPLLWQSNDLPTSVN
ncbi:MAG: S49 family peptidase, partial [Cyanobacteria bacterium P01_E01_bin.34]